MKQQVQRPFIAYGKQLQRGEVVETGHFLNADLLTNQGFLGPAILDLPVERSTGGTPARATRSRGKDENDA